MTGSSGSLRVSGSRSSSRRPGSTRRSARAAQARWTILGSARSLDPGAVRTMRTLILALMLVAALTLLAASAVHASLLGPIDPFPGAAPPEAVLGLVLAIAAVAASLSWARSRPVGVVGTFLAPLGTVYRPTVTVRRGEPG